MQQPALGAACTSKASEAEHLAFKPGDSVHTTDQISLAVVGDGPCSTEHLVSLAAKV
jgi:hypothetical protein